VFYASTEDKFEEGRTISKLTNLRNCIIFIKTNVPEGIPFEKIKWKGATSKVYEYLISYEGDDTTNSFFCCD